MLPRVRRAELFEPEAAIVDRRVDRFRPVRGEAVGHQMLRGGDRLRANDERGAQRTGRDALAKLADECLRRVAADAGPYGRSRRRTQPARDRVREVVGLAERRRIARDRVFERAQRADGVDLRNDARIIQRVTARAARGLDGQLDTGKPAVLRRIEPIGVLTDTDDHRRLRMGHDRRTRPSLSHEPAAGRRRRLRRACEALRHRHPFVCDFAAHSQPGVCDVARLRDDLAELHGRAFDAIALIRLVPGPPRTRWTLQAEVRLDRRHGAAAIRERPAKGVHAHDGDVADAIALIAHAAEQIERRLPVRPRLHLARADA